MSKKKSIIKQMMPASKKSAANLLADSLTYVRVKRGDIAETRELVQDHVFADFDERGKLLGVEVVR